jgi:hypothetical protein
MIILLALIAIVVAGVPLAAVLLVTVASRREENAGSIGRGAHGRIERAARRLLAFHAVGIGIGRPACVARGRGPRRGHSRPAGSDRYRGQGSDRYRGQDNGRYRGQGSDRHGEPGRAELAGAGPTVPRRRP